MTCLFRRRRDERGQTQRKNNERIASIALNNKGVAVFDPRVDLLKPVATDFRLDDEIAA